MARVIKIPVRPELVRVDGSVVTKYRMVPGWVRVESDDPQDDVMASFGRDNWISHPMIDFMLNNNGDSALYVELVATGFCQDGQDVGNLDVNDNQNVIGG